MSIKKYSSGSWVTVPYRKYETATDTITSLPKTIIGDGQPISAYTIKGNMQQSGTPTPSNPIYPQECGDLVTSGEHAGEYKIPILSNGVSYPVYLAEPIRKKDSYVDTLSSTGIANRIIKQVVFTGQESWGKVSGTHGFYTDLVDLSVSVGADCIICSHYIASTSGDDGTLRMANNKHEVLIYDDYASAADFQTFLQQQYANGTPVTVWYVLATPTTESFTAPTIPTSGTAQSFDVSTTLKPSEVSLTYHGWHEHSDTKFTE